jgi:hypothetical protein
MLLGLDEAVSEYYVLNGSTQTRPRNNSVVSHSSKTDRISTIYDLTGRAVKGKVGNAMTSVFIIKKSNSIVLKVCNTPK